MDHEIELEWRIQGCGSNGKIEGESRETSSQAICDFQSARFARSREGDESGESDGRCESDLSVQSAVSRVRDLGLPRSY